MKKKHALKSRTIIGILTAAAGLAGAGSLISADPAIAAQIDRWAGVAGLALAFVGRLAAGGLSLMPTETPAPPA